MKFLIVTNRELQSSSARDETLFGEGVNKAGPSVLRLAWARKNKGKWRLQLIDEPSSVDPENPPSRKVLSQYMRRLKNNKKDCVVYIHGYNKKFKESIKQAHDISQLYGVGVIAFSWPSNPRIWVSEEEYKEAMSIASNSIVALDRTLEKVELCARDDRRVKSKISINLLIHSLGNYILEKFVKDPIFSGETRVFDNIIMNAADVDLDTHVEWTKNMKYARRVYATINDKDWILNLSESVNPDRLGNTPRHLTSDRLTYFDLSDGKNVGNKHQHFGTTARRNPVVKQFFSNVLHGKQGLPLPGVIFDIDKNAHVLEEKEDDRWNDRR